MNRVHLLYIIIIASLVQALFSQTQDIMQYVNQNDININALQARIIAKAKNDKLVESYQLIQFNNLESIKSNPSFNITLPDKSSLKCEKKWSHAIKENKWAIGGNLGSNGSMFLSITDDEVYGNINRGKDLYWIKPLGNGLQMLMKVDLTKLPLDEPEEWNPTINKEEPSQLISEQRIETTNLKKLGKSSSSATIDVLFAYTPSVAMYNPNMLNFALACQFSIAQSYSNSNMSDIGVNVVGVVQVDYNESGDVLTDNDRLVSPNDGFLDNIYLLREQYHADVVALVVNDDFNGHAGVAAAIHALPEQAFLVVVDDYCIENYTFSHELGHIIGARHDDDVRRLPLAYSHGYKYLPGKWRTIMGQYHSAESDIIRVNNWSSPIITRQGVPMGTTDWNDDRRVWIERASAVAGFRASYIPPVPSISGPSMIYHPADKGRYNTYSWTSSINGGSSPFSYRWYKDGVLVGTNSTYAEILGYNGEGGSSHQWTLSLSITDVINNGGVTNKIISEDNEIEKRGEWEEDIPIEYSLTQNMPNPFNPNTIIHYSLPKDGYVSLIVYDLLGKEVAILVDNQKRSGNYSIEFDGSKLSSGMYIYKFISGSFTQTKRMMLIK